MVDPAVGRAQALPEHRALKKLRLAPPSSMLLPRETDDAALAAQLAAVRRPPLHLGLHLGAS
eukprot:6177071-Pleurochrysis_carterae.AAC.6